MGNLVGSSITHNAKNKKRNDMEEKLIDLMWEVKEGKKHPNRAYKELCVLFNVGISEANVCPKCGYPKFKKHHEDFERCNGCDWTSK